ncbi:transcriptional regulator, AraC family [Rhodopseudomonas palustris HaA2]|uniref:Transcriptional regulator, AraC family n=1 Tax=Rhodopseudomonas palustris (strain HaA2) TaxID=316058 RepID=Q2IUJ7_RHOP2|nr:AraC family transcriptional regulator [Rhodopseudomonas palustris]ABD08113.1 transcriptional regulator, AraC family [Rhodopseudomonas palustris HaA2]
MGTLGNSVDKYVTGRMLQTSNDRRWSHLLAERWSHQAGELPSLLPRDTEIAVLLRGSSVVDRAGGGMRQRTHGRRGTIWLCPAGIREDFIRVESEMHECLHIFLPGRPFDDTMLQDMDIDPARIGIRYEAIGQDIFIDYVADQIVRELAEESSTGRLLIESLGRALTAHLVHRYADTAVPRKPANAASRPLDAKRLTRVTDFINASVERDFTVSDLAAVACMSPAHFSRSFKAATGCAPHEYLSRQRLDLAKRLLASGHRSLADIAYATGFSSQANFNRAFRKALGTTPSAYRAQQRSD